MATKNNQGNRSGNRNGTKNSGGRGSSNRYNSNRNGGNRSGKGRGSNAGSGSRSSNRSGNGSRKGNRKTGSEDKLTKIFLVLLAVLIVLLLILLWPEKDDDSGTKQPATPSAVPTEPLKKPTTEPEKEPTKMPETTPTPPATTPEPTPTEIPVTVPDEYIAAKIKDASYTWALSDDHLYLDNRTFYSYSIQHNQQEMEVLLLVDRATGEVYYFDGNEVKDMDSFPPKGTSEEEKTELGGKLTVEQAKEWLAGISYEAMALPVPLSECELALDDWETFGKTYVEGVECYCLNAFHSGVLVGTIYFDEEAKAVFYQDEFGEFIRVK